MPAGARRAARRFACERLASSLSEEYFCATYNVNVYTYI